MRSTTVPYTESRLAHLVRNKCVGFPVVEQPESTLSPPSATKNLATGQGGPKKTNLFSCKSQTRHWVCPPGFLTLWLLLQFYNHPFVGNSILYRAILKNTNRRKSAQLVNIGVWRDAVHMSDSRFDSRPRTEGDDVFELYKAVNKGKGLLTIVHFQYE